MGSLVLSDVCYAYDNDLSGKKITAENVTEEDMVLKHLDLSVEDGEFVCLVGHSGCGKTTTLRTLAGLHKPLRGSIAIAGKPLNGPGLDRAVVFQNYALFPWMTAVENVEFGLKQASKELGRNQSKAEMHQIALAYLSKVSMGDAANLKPYQMSGGMQQRVAIARALAMDTEILLFDEPFGALDIKTRRELQMLMQSLRIDEEAPKTAVFVTHDIEEAVLLADRVVFMSGGQLRDEFYVKAPRPRDPETFVKEKEYISIRNELLKLFYRAVENRNRKENPVEMFREGAE